MGNGPYNHKQAKFGDDVDNLDLDLDDLGSGELSKNFAPPRDPMQKNTIDEKMGKFGGGNNETLGLGNDTIGHYDRIAVGPGGTAGNRLDQTGGGNDTLNFYVTALKKEENQKSETGGEDYMDHGAIDGGKKK